MQTVNNLRAQKEFRKAPAHLIALAVINTLFFFSGTGHAQTQQNKIVSSQQAINVDREQRLPAVTSQRNPAPAPPAVVGDKTRTANSADHNRNSVQFSEWMKDNPAATRTASKDQVSEAEIRRTLSAAMQQAVGRSPMLRQSQAEVAASDADVREAKGERWPQIDLGANNRPTSLGGGNSNNLNSQAINLNMTTNVFDWGRTRNTIDSRKELSTAAGQKYFASLETLAQDVSITIVEREKARRISTISQQYVERMSTLVGMLQQIVQVDRGRASELTQAKARLMEAQASLDASQAKERDVEIKLRKLIGDAEVQMPDNSNWALSAGDLDKLLAAARNHPSLLQAEAEANASERHAESLRAGEKPQLNWVVSKSTARDELGREQGWQTMMTVNWPLFRGGSARAAREAASLRAEAGREKKDQQALDFEFATRAAEQDAKTSLSRADLYRDLTSETDSVRKAFFEQWYHLGRRTLLDVLIAESDHNNNRVNEVANRFDGYKSVLEAYGSAGQLTNWLQGKNADN
ncbi:TolC family protein [Pseudomonas zeae]|uniref:TolC family protein n=1 Tax=Pseudomonas zeae TaxID=2745510 RepID=A0A9E6TAV6_9PSED|nr:TolC family protein [Pseudomonas zeae]QXI11256.1 TolC family protein [Pseudomonas zeae]